MPPKLTDCLEILWRLHLGCFNACQGTEPADKCHQGARLLSGHSQDRFFRNVFHALEAKIKKLPSQTPEDARIEACQGSICKRIVPASSSCPIQGAVCKSQQR